MLQIHIIADKSEILPQKPRKRKSKKKKDDEDNAEEEFMEEPMIGGDAIKSKSKRPKKPAKAQKRKIVRTPLDVGTIRALLSQIDAEKYQESIDWLKECLDDAAEDTEEPSEEDDGVPLVPLQAQQKEAMEDEHFKKVLVALGVQPPVMGMETYWRIPTYLNSADLKLRAKIVGGEEIEIDVDGIDDDDDGNDDEDGNDDSDDNNNGNSQDGEESEEDYLETLGIANERRKLDNLESFRDQQREKLKSLMFSKSDDETEERAPLKGKKKPRAKKETKAPKPKKKQQSDSDDDPEMVNKIKKKLDKKKRNYDLSSEEESGDEDTFKMPEEKETVKPDTSDLFDQLKSKRASSKIKLSDMVKEKQSTKKSDSTNADDDADFNFSSEHYRKRLAELEDEDDKADVNDDDNDDGSGDTKDVEREKTLSNRSRRANVIESDDDSGDDNNAAVDSSTHDDNAIKGQTKKRRRSLDKEQSLQISGDEEDESAAFLARKKPSPSDQAAAETGEEPAKRRRVAIIDDDDEDDY